MDPITVLPALDTLTALWPVLVTLGLLTGIAGALIAPSKGQVPWKWWVLCGVGGLLALSVLACLPRRSVLAPAQGIVPAPARDTASPKTLRRPAQGE